MIDITPIVNAVIALVAMIITAVLIPELKKLLQARIGVARTESLLQWIDVFVSAAEQTISNNVNKKQFVIESLQAIGYTVNDEVDAAIEAAVLDLHAALK